MKYIVWLKNKESTPAAYRLESDKWEEQGDGPLTTKQANRIAKEIERECGVQTRIHSVGFNPNLL